MGTLLDGLTRRERQSELIKLGIKMEILWQFSLKCSRSLVSFFENYFSNTKKSGLNGYIFKYTWPSKIEQDEYK